jgi:hypothetical protein
MLKKGYSDYQQDIKEDDKKHIDFPIFGLVNPPKSYNCFLNAIVQSFWMMDSFRDFFIWYSSLFDAQDDKFIQELKCFFNEIAKTPKNEFDIQMKIYYLKDLRQELSTLEGYENKFNIGEMWDATELYDVILTKVQANLTKAPAGTISTWGTILQEIIGLNVHIQWECPCGKTFELPQNKDQYLIYVSAYGLCDRVGVNRKDDLDSILDKYMKYNQKLGEVVRDEMQKSLEFPDKDHFKACKQVEQATFKMTTSKEPEVLCFDVKWGEYEHIDVLTCFNLIPNSIKLSDIYTLEGQNDWEYILKGIVIYWGAHFYAFFRIFVDGGEQWVRVDDKCITKKDNWKDIVTDCVGTMVTPTIILFEKYKESTLVPTMRRLEKDFEIDKYSLRSLAKDSSTSKKKAQYRDCFLDFVNQESTPINNEESKENFESESSKAEKREKEDIEENKNAKNYEEDKKEDDMEDPDFRRAEPKIDIPPPPKEDEWIWDHWTTINLINNYKWTECRRVS